MSTDPQALLKRGSELLGTSPHLGQVANLGKPLGAAGKAAAAAAVSHGIESVGDRLRRKADAVRGGQEAGAEPERKPRRRSQPEDEYAEDEYAEGDFTEGDFTEGDDAGPEEAEDESERPRPARRRAARRELAATGGAPVRRQRR